MLKKHTHTRESGESEMTGSYLIRVWVNIRPLDLPLLLLLLAYCLPRLSYSKVKKSTRSHLHSLIASFAQMAI